MNQPATNSPGGFKDRRGALIGFGILVIAIGCVSALFAAFIGLMALVAPASGMPAPGYAVLPSALLYAVLAVVFIWLGIGSIKTRRWARALLLILSWLWLLTGIVTVAFMAVVMPKILAVQSGRQPMPAGFAAVFLVVMLAMTFVLFILLPGLLVLFYRSPHVKATCEARDPVARWTDACPLPVLALSLMLAFGAVSMLIMVVPYHGMVPFFGRLVNGIPGGGILIAMAALWGYCAWATYRLDPKGWWICVVGFGVWTISAVLTFARVDLIEMYRMMGYSGQQLAQMEQFSGAFGGSTLLLLMIMSAVLWFGYLLFVKRYFRQPS
jgi:hypothetical protein